MTIPEAAPCTPLRVAVLGSTGSIGAHTLDVIAAFPDRYRAVALAAGSNVVRLAEQIVRYRPRFVACAEPFAADGATTLPLAEIAAHPEVDALVVGTAGTSALPAVITALEHGKTVALANKEILVMAGRAITEAARRGGGALRPVDSEHSAIWQCLWGEAPSSVRAIILTASGGAFRDLPADQLAAVTPEQALTHPTWQMGRKITVDSATLMNKGLETIEARWLFDVPMEQVEVLMHRESIVHSLVEFSDGSVKAQLGLPDMRLPIMCALSYPHRLPSAEAPRLRLGQLQTLHFGEPDFDRYPCLSLAMAAGRAGGCAPAVLVGAGDAAVEGFLTGAIGFGQMAAAVESALAAAPPDADESLDAVLAAERWARTYTENWIASRRQ